MPLLQEIELLGTTLWVWELLESDYQIAESLNCISAIDGIHFKKRHDRLSFGWQFVLQSVLGQQYLGVYKDVQGKPFLLNSKLQLSVAHTRQIIVCALHQSKKIGVDIEACSPKISRVKHKFMSTVELSTFDKEVDLTQVWCAKEAMFKLNGEHGISFKQDILVKQISASYGEIFLRHHFAAQYASLLLGDLMIVIALEA